MVEKNQVSNELSDLKIFVKERGLSAREVQRAQAILMLERRLNIEVIVEITGLKRSSIFAIKRKYLQHGVGALRDKYKRRSRELLKKSERNEIIEMLKMKSPRDYDYDKDFWSTALLGNLIENKYGVRYKSKTSLYLIFKGASFSYHKPGEQYRNRKQEVIDQWKEEKLPIIKEHIANAEWEVLVGDEVILTTQTTFQKVWLPQNSYPKIEVSNKWDRRSVYGLLNMKTGKAHAFKTTEQTMISSCKALDQLSKIYDKKIMLIWDNASWHKGSGVKEYLSNNPEKFYLINFPPYAPELNPQEKVWKQARRQITHNKFIEKIDITSDEFVNFINNTNFHYKLLE